MPKTTTKTTTDEKAKKPTLSPQEESIYKFLKTSRKKSGVKVKDIREAHPDMVKSRVSDVLRHLKEKGMVVLVEPGYYAAK